jgi:uncharacterized protein (DUF1800 family)
MGVRGVADSKRAVPMAFALLKKKKKKKNAPLKGKHKPAHKHKKPVHHKHKHKHKHKPKPKPKPKPNAPAPLPSNPTEPVPKPSPAAPPVTTPTTPEAPPSPVGTHVDGPSVPVYSGTFGTAQATRLLWRAGFGPRPGDAAALATKSLQDAVQSLTRPSGDANLVGPDPHDSSGNPLAPADVYGNDHVWWLDRIVRSDQPLVERMTLIWHDWFATSNDNVNNQQLMLDQNQLFRTKGLGSFIDLAQAVTADPAMLIWLNGIDNHKWAPNENYARELMELFTLGADRGAYTETDVREMARVLTGWDADWDDAAGKLVNFRFRADYHDTGSKTVFGQTGRWTWDGAVPLVVGNAYHRSFFVKKLWSYFIPSAPDDATQAALEAVYVNGGYQIRDVVEAILMHPDLYNGAPMVKNPAVFTAGLLRTLGRYVDTTNWYWRMDAANMQLFYPPNVAGWNDQAWLDTSTLQARWNIVYEAFSDRYVPINQTYSSTETAAEALTAAQAFLGNPAITTQSLAALLSFATSAVPGTVTGNTAKDLRAQRQNALRHLIATSPDLQVS